VADACNHRIQVFSRDGELVRCWGGPGEEPGLRVRNFINQAVAQRGVGRERDRAGLIIFGRRPRLELPPSDATRFDLTGNPTAEAGNYTDIGAALKLALASFPADTGNRIVLISVAEPVDVLDNYKERDKLAWIPMQPHRPNKTGPW
jgi:hypothetical protein